MTTYEEVKQVYKNNNCELLEFKYIADKKLCFKCYCGFIDYKLYYDFVKTPKCNKCSASIYKNRIRYNYDYVKKYFESEGCLLLETEYQKSTTPMRYICICGKENITTFSVFKSGCRCFECGKKKLRSKKQFSYDYVKDVFKNHNCILLETEYINCDTPMKYICKCGNINMITLYKLQKGQNCKKCSIEKRSGENHFRYNPDLDFVFRKKKWQKVNNCLIRHIHRDFKINKRKKSYDLLGYSPQIFGQYIENHTEYKSVMQKIEKTKDKLSIDHIFPVYAFVEYNLDKEEYICVVNCLENLRPMALRDNIKKSNIYNKLDFELWLKNKGVNFISKIV